MRKFYEADSSITALAEISVQRKPWNLHLTSTLFMRRKVVIELLNGLGWKGP